MLDLLMFHESFDSVRAGSLQADVNPELAQVQTESLLTLLLGRSIVLNNSMAFDSRTVLHLAQVVFDAAAAVADRTGTTPLRLCQQEPPFTLRRFKTPTLLSGSVDQLRRLGAHNRFILSAWHTIDRDDAARLALADALERIQAGLGASATAVPDPIRDDTLASQQLSTLERLHHYFRDVPGTDHDTVETRYAVKDRIRNIQANGAGWMTDLARQVDCPQEHAEDIYRAVGDPDAELVTRGWVHGPDIDDKLGARVAGLVRELVDTLYNAQLAASAGAQDAYLSTPPRSRNLVVNAQVNRLALAIAKLDPGRPVTDLGSPGSAVQAPMSGLFTTVGMERNVSVAPLHTIFQAYWELIADPESRETWRRSCAMVNRLYRHRVESPGARHQFAEAWDSHLALLRGRFGQSLLVDGDTVQVVGAQNGEAYGQSNQPGTLRWASLEEATAAGEYLDLVSRAAR
ncbi:MAG TPA: hypothetical protein VFC00_20140 [Micromonosporaceae bacterium]|nr:hypothetical protein [Micromonosporaceae bacterium]